MTAFIETVRSSGKQGILTDGRITLYQEAEAIPAGDQFRVRGQANHAAIALIGFPHNVISFIGDSVHVRSSF